MDNNLAKELFFHRAYATGESIFVQVNMRKIGVIVPGGLYQKPSVTFQFGLNLPNPIKKMEVTKDGIRAMLSFGGQDFLCSFPWYAIWRMDVPERDSNLVCPVDAPPEVNVTPELPPTGSDGPSGCPTGHPGTEGPTGGPVKPKRQLPSGWGVFPGGKGAA